MNTDETGLYNSRILKTAIEYLQRYYPSLDIDASLRAAGIHRYEVDDPGHWFTQSQMDRHYDFVVRMTGNSNLARETGRYTAYSPTSNPLKQYAIGFITPGIAYWLVEKLGQLLGRNLTYKTRKIARNQIEVVTTPRPAVHDKPYQCESRIGMLEAIAKWFTDEFADVEHPQCLHTGSEQCVYLITWKDLPSLMWKRMRNYMMVFSAAAIGLLFFILPGSAWGMISLICSSLTGCCAWYAEYLANKELKNTLERQGNTAKELFEEMDRQYHDVVLVQEIGQAISSTDSVETLIKVLLDILETRLDFDRGLVLLPDAQATYLEYIAAYGYTSSQEMVLRETTFSLDPDPKGIFSSTFVQQHALVLYDRDDIEQHASQQEKECVSHLNLRSLMCIPIVYGPQTLCLLAVEHSASQQFFTKTELNLLTTIASQVAINIIKIRSFEQIHASLKEKESLLKEIHHRVKNNMQIISSLLSLEAHLLPNDHARTIFQESQHRIRTMSLIHERLYQSEDLGRIRFQEYITSLVHDLYHAYKAPSSRIQCVIDAGEIALDIDAAIPCGLIINELVSNALKYAFPEKNGTIVISLNAHAKGMYELIVRDDGVGLPEGLELENLSSLGLQLVQGFVEEQLDGRLDIQRTQGTTFRIEFSTNTL